MHQTLICIPGSTTLSGGLHKKPLSPDTVAGPHQNLLQRRTGSFLFGAHEKASAAKRSLQAIHPVRVLQLRRGIQQEGLPVSRAGAAVPEAPSAGAWGATALPRASNQAHGRSLFHHLAPVLAVACRSSCQPGSAGARGSGRCGQPAGGSWPAMRPCHRPSGTSPS